MSRTLFNQKLVNMQNRKGWLLSISGLLVVLATFVIYAPSVSAVSNNRSNIPQSILNQLANPPNPQTIYATNSTGPGEWCEPTGTYAIAQFSWISHGSDSAQDTSVAIGEGTDRLALRYNAITAGCDRIFTPSGAWSRSSTEVVATQANVIEASARIVGGPSLGISGLGEDTPLRFDYSRAYNNRLRFVKRSDEQPEHRRFSIQGLSGLSPGTYTVRVTTKDYMVHRHRHGHYRCVYGDERVYGGFKDNTGCTTLDVNLNIQVNVLPRYEGQCEILEAPKAVALGERFGARFRVENVGSRNWSMFWVKMATNRPADTNRWGPARIPIEGSGITNHPTVGPVLNSGNTTTWTTSSNRFIAKEVGTHRFAWRIIQERSGDPNIDGGFPGVVDNMALCETEIKVYENRNYPYVRGTTNDVWSGAVFGDCSPSNPIRAAASAANIRANTLNSANALAGRHEGFEEAIIFVARLYTIANGSNPPLDSSGAMFWVNRYLNDDRYNEAAVIRQFLVAEDIYDESDESKGDFINRLYENLYGRPPASDESNYWLNEYSGSRQHMTLTFIRAADRAPFGLGQSFYNYGGSGSDYGIFSTGSNNIQSGGLDGMVGSNGSSQSEVFSLTFANTGVDDETNSFGYGDFTNSPLCLPDYYAEYSEREDVEDGSVTISGQNISADNPVVRVIDGDVTINGNIIYDYDSYSSAGVPGFILIVRGDITINEGVDRLDGIYIAQPRSSSEGGTISTCQTTTEVAGDTGCSARQLKVNGSLIAQKLQLRRTYGSLGATFYGETGNLVNEQCSALSNFWGNNPSSFGRLYSTAGDGGSVNRCAAEWVDSHPERYFMRRAGDGGNNIQSFRELPPIF